MSQIGNSRIRVKIIHFQETNKSQIVNRLFVLLKHLCYEGKPRRGSNLKCTKAAAKQLKKEAFAEFAYEEKHLFPFLRKHIPRLEAAIVMLQNEHQEFRLQFKSFEQALKLLSGVNSCSGSACKAVYDTGMYLVYFLRKHIGALKRKTYAVAEKNMRPDELKQWRALVSRKDAYDEKSRDPIHDRYAVARA